MRIAVYGLGYVGLTGACCLSSEGHQVIGIDVSGDKVDQVNAGISPISEPGLAELLKKARKEGFIEATQSLGEGINSCDMAIVCVGTPSAPDGSHNMGYIAEVTRQIAASINRKRARPLTVVYRSTVRPGTMEELIDPIFRVALGNNLNDLIELVYNPEFLREAVAISDYFNPPKIVVGTREGDRSSNMDLLNTNLTAPIFYVPFREAEFTKFIDNTWHATKVTYANEIGRLCAQLGISARKIHEIFISDTKLNISPYYMRPGGAFGGSCLPKDVRALQSISGEVGGHTALIDALLRSNDAHKHFLYEHCVKDLAQNSRILLVGLSFKANSDDLRESPNVDLTRKLLNAGYKLSIYDPSISAAKLVGQNLGYAYSNLPRLSQLLISRELAESEEWDLVVDAHGLSRKMNLRAARTFNVNEIS
ncbi:MAG: nucleotide sugar dehydrogenase [Rhizomicrobium sp.]